MIHPLVGYDKRTFRLRKVGNGILSKDSDTVGIDQLRNTVVDLGINMVRTSGKNNAPSAGFFQICKNLFPFLLHILSGVCQFFPGLMNGSDDFLCIDFFKFRCQCVTDCLFIPEGHKGIAQAHLTAGDLFYVVFDVFRVGSYNRTVVMVVGFRGLVALIKEGGIKNKVNLLVDQPFHMAVSQLGGITFRFTGNGLDAKLINLTVGNRR